MRADRQLDGDGLARQSPLANVSRRMVQLHKDYYGKGPTRAKTYYQGDLVVVLLRGGFTKVEQTLFDDGRAKAVLRQRSEFQDVMGDRFKVVVREELEREVIAFMSMSHQDPDISAELFVLDPAESPEPHMAEEHEHDGG